MRSLYWQCIVDTNESKAFIKKYFTFLNDYRYSRETIKGNTLYKALICCKTLQFTGAVLYRFALQNRYTEHINQKRGCCKTNIETKSNILKVKKV